MIVYCDNKAVVKTLKKRLIQGIAIQLLQIIFLIAALWNIKVDPIWISSKQNAMADALSRFDMKRVANLIDA